MAEQNTNSFETFAIKLGSSRIIYNLADRGAALLVINPQQYPMLVQPQILNEDKRTAAPFIVTPPLFRLDAMQQNRLRIIYTGDSPPVDREQLYWTCVSALPPTGADDDTSATPSAAFRVQVQLNTCIKTMLRPARLKGTLTDAARKLRWHINNGKLTAHNNSAYYLSFKYIHLNGKQIEHPEYIAPFSSQAFTVATNNTSTVLWRVITDHGSNSQEMSATPEQE